MKRLFPILAIAFMMAFGSVSATTNTVITASTIVNPLQDDTSSDDVESLGFHQELKKRFIEGGPGFMGIVLICLILGTFIEIVPVFYLTVPVFAALVLSLNQNLLHLYVVFVAFAGIGMITPPVCVGIYTAAGVIREDPAKAFKEVPLFVGVGIIYGVLMIFLPAASTWLPSILR